MERKKILFGSVISTILIILISFSNVVASNCLNNQPEKDILEEYDYNNAIHLVFQLLIKLRNNPNIIKLEEKIDKNDDVTAEISNIINTDIELFLIVENLKSFNCGCEDNTKLNWNFPIICVLLIPALTISLGIYLASGLMIFLKILGFIGLILNCFWA